jgi:hypothetical protein
MARRDEEPDRDLGLEPPAAVASSERPDHSRRWPVKSRLAPIRVSVCLLGTVHYLRARGQLPAAKHPSACEVRQEARLPAHVPVLLLTRPGDKCLAGTPVVRQSTRLLKDVDGVLLEPALKLAHLASGARRITGRSGKPIVLSPTSATIPSARA